MNISENVLSKGDFHAHFRTDWSEYIRGGKNTNTIIKIYSNIVEFKISAAATKLSVIDHPSCI